MASSERPPAWGPDEEYAPGWVVLARARFSGGNDAEAAYLEQVGRPLEGIRGRGGAPARARERR